MHATTRKMQAGGQDYRQRLTMTFVASLRPECHEVYCVGCGRKLLETSDQLAYISDVSDAASAHGRPTGYSISCTGYCRLWYELRAIPGSFVVETTKIFFITGQKRHREVHCYSCKEVFCTVTTGVVHGVNNPQTALRADTNGFVPTFCVGDCGIEYEIAAK